MTQAPQNEQKQTTWHPNRNYLTLSSNIIVDSCFPGGNVASANIITSSPLTIQIQGNTDVSLDSNAKYWLYFRIRGFRRDRPIKFILKNANHLRKYYGQTRYKTYMMYRQDDEQWQANSTPIDISILQNGHLQGTFTYQAQKCKIGKTIRSTNDLFLQKEEKNQSTTTGKQDKRGDCYFAVYQPYTYDDLITFLDRTKKKQESVVHSKKYYHQETITYSYQRRKIKLITITSKSNIQSFTEKEPMISQEIFPFPKERPHKMNNNPVIMFTARVHPSQTYSSFFIEGLIQFLLSDCKAADILRQMFIFQIIPMLNPDGVDHGNFRFDHQMRNLNRYYGQSSIDKTPSIRAAELLISYYKNRNSQQCQFTQFYEETYSRMFMYIDVHGHSSAMPSFIYGNHAEKIEHLIENKMFCKLIENNFISGGFSKLESEFSKKNMNVQEKYDQFSKEGAGRVFAGKAETPEQIVFHSYTLELLPYWEQFTKRKVQLKVDKITASEYARQLGKEVMTSVLDLLDLNPDSKFNDNEIDRLRKFIVKQCYNQQLRRVFLYKRAQSSNERSSFSQISKAKQSSNQKQYPYHNEYIVRWFNNEIFRKHFMNKSILQKQPKFLKFFQKISRVFQLPSQLPLESPRIEERQRHCQSQPKQEPKSRQEQKKRKEQAEQKAMSIFNNKCFVSRDQRKLISNQQKLIAANRSKDQKRTEMKLISKHTIELTEQPIDLLPRHRTIDRENYKFQRRQLSIRKQPSQKKDVEYLEKYEKQILHKLHTEGSVQPIFTIRPKELKAKPKSNIRLQTQLAAEPDSSSCAKSKNCHSQANSINQPGMVEQHCYAKPSFIEEFIMKIREERQQRIVSSKCSQKEQLRYKILKYRPSIKQQVEQSQNSVLPVLKRNKIFTIASEPPHKQSSGPKGYETTVTKKRTTPFETNPQAEDLIHKTKQLLNPVKKEELSIMKSQKFSQYALV